MENYEAFCPYHEDTKAAYLCTFKECNKDRPYCLKCILDNSNFKDHQHPGYSHQSVDAIYRTLEKKWQALEEEVGRVDKGAKVAYEKFLPLIEVLEKPRFPSYEIDPNLRLISNDIKDLDIL